MTIQVSFAEMTDRVIETGFLGFPECYVQDCNEPAVERRTLAICRDGKHGPLHIQVMLCERCLDKGAEQLWEELRVK